MRQLFYNLLNNALKFSLPDMPPCITINLEETANSPNGYCTISISDNGIGFPQDKSEKIFTMFQRLHSRDEFGGTGIGLALCKKVVLNHDGAIWAVAEPGNGATFFVRLPLQDDGR
jgi:signal transduction histidine kinase